MMKTNYPPCRSLAAWIRLPLIFLLILIFTNAKSQQVAEFSGELKTWANVIKRFGAKGDGRKDDTRALQMALDSLSVLPKNFNTGKRAYSVVYLPAGTYRITAPLVLKGKIGISIIGESPDQTSILYDGKEGQAMLSANGSAYFKVSRINWNANKKDKITCIALQWKSRWNDKTSQSFAPVNIEISDSYFSGGAYYGILGGTYQSENATGANDSEVAIQRCTFQECTFAGIKIEGFNALDYWIWDCTFNKCKRGIDNSHGNYHAYRCYFNQSYDTDIINDNGYYTSVRNCYSFNSNCFSHDQGVSCNPFKRIFQGNHVQSMKGNDIYFAHLGKVSLLDNTFTKGSKTPGEYTLNYGSWCKGIYEVLSVGNRFGLNKPLKIDAGPQIIHSISDQKGVVAVNKALAGSVAAMQEPIPQNRRRKIIGISPDASTDVIQQHINTASSQKGSRTILHFGWGTYKLEKPLIIPADSDIQILGDGLIYATILVKSDRFPPGKPLILVKGPTRIEIRDIQLFAHDVKPDQSNAVEFENVDQKNSQVFIDQLHSSAAWAVHLDELDYLYVQKQNSFFSTGNKVSGGPLMKQGRGTAGLHCFGGQFANLKVEGNGEFVAKDCWWEGASRIPLNIQGSGNITLDGIMIAPVSADSNTTINIGRFKGKVSILNAYIQGSVSVDQNNPDLDILIWNSHFYHKMNPLSFLNQRASFRGAFLGISAQCFETTNKNCSEILSFDDQLLKVQRKDEFLTDLLALDRRSVPKKYLGGKVASSVLMSRVSVGNCNTGIKFSK